MQIAGNTCKLCERRIILSIEGKFCAPCGTVAHLTCEPRAQCNVCDQLYQFFEPAKADPMADAVLPPALRPTSSGIPMTAALLMLLLFFMGIILCYAFLGSLASGQ